MPKYIDISLNNFHDNIKKATQILKDNNVISLMYLSNYYVKELEIVLKDGSNINNKALTPEYQFKINGEMEFEVIEFDRYGKKTKSKTFTNKLQFKKEIYSCLSGKLYLERFYKFGKKYKSSYEFNLKDSNYILTYHKQKSISCNKELNTKSNEEDLKIEVYKWLLNKSRESIIIPEFSINENRADFVSFDDKKIKCTIVEIKSARDTFDRLDKQLSTYSSIADYVYLAIDKAKYQELFKKEIELPDHIGILIFDNSKKKKLYQIKRAIKNNYKSKTPFLQFLSYKDINDSFLGFKYCSKLSKEQKENILNELINKKTYNQFAYDTVKNRYIIESDLRKKLLDSNEILKSISSSSSIGINRFSPERKECITLHKYNINKNILYEYYINKERYLLDQLKDISNFIKELRKPKSKVLIELMCYLKDRYLYLEGVSSKYERGFKSFYFISDSLSFYKAIINHKQHILNFINKEK